MRKISSIKTSKVLLLLMLMTAVFVGCGDSDDDDGDEYGNWVKSSTFDGDSRSGAASFTIGNKGYVFGGFDGDDYLSDLWVYDSEEDSWKEIGLKEEIDEDGNTINVSSFPGYIRSGAVGFSIGDKGYVGTGYGYNDDEDKYTEFKDFYEYDSATDTWSEVGEIADFPDTARTGAIGFAINGYGYVGTGDDGSQQKDFYRYDAATNSWEQSTGFGGEKREGASVFVINDVAYIGGGIQNGATQTDFYKFDGTTWTDLTDLDDDDEDNEVLVTSGVAFSIGGKGYIGAGLFGSVNKNVWEYDPSDDSWEEVPEFQGSARQSASAFTFESSDKAFVLMGRSGSFYFDDVWEFKPEELENEDD